MEWSVMKRYFPMKFLMGFAMCALVAFGVMAQTGTTSIHGVVTDKSGATVAAAKVTLLNPGLSLQRSIDSGPEGNSSFSHCSRVLTRSPWRRLGSENSSRKISSRW